MTYYILPQIEYTIRDSNLKLLFNEKDSTNLKSYSLQKYSIKIKSLIDKHLNDWDQIKKYTNPYEFIHTIIPGQKVSVSKYKPISRAFFKIMRSVFFLSKFNFSSFSNKFKISILFSIKFFSKIVFNAKTE